jgi:hypothetical protein
MGLDLAFHASPVVTVGRQRGRSRHPPLKHRQTEESVAQPAVSIARDAGC